MKLAPFALATPFALAAIAALAAGPVAAFDIAKMTDAERAAFQTEIRSYLLAHPEVLDEMANALDAQKAETQAVVDRDLVSANRADLDSDPASYVGGNPEGDLTVVEFIDYRCGYCRKAHGEVAELVRSDGNIRYVVKEYPILSEQSVMAARVAIAVLRELGPEAYAKVNAGFYESFRGDITDTTVAAFLTGLGLDAERVMAHANDAEVTQILRDNHDLAKRLQIQGTPTFVIGDTMLRGYAPLDHMRQLVSGERG